MTRILQAITVLAYLVGVVVLVLDMLVWRPG